MKDSFTQSMDWLHTWGGLLFGWLLFVIFFSGTLTVFDKEITYWMQPELHHLPAAALNVDAVTRQLSTLGGNSDHWWIELPTNRLPVTKIFWKRQDQFEERLIEPLSGKPVAVRDTHGGEFFYRFHYQLHLDRVGVWVVGASALVMLVALVTGLVIHRRIFKDFFTFRPRSSPHRAWLDVHNLTGVLVLPFHFMITFTGLVIFGQIYIPAGVDLLYGGDEEQVVADMEQRIERSPQHNRAPLVSLETLERRAREHWDGGTTEWIEVHNPGDRHALVEITRRTDDRLALVSDRVTFDGATGETLQVWKATQPAFLTYSVVIGLHYIWFDKITIRWLYFLMGLAASVMIATGLVLWTVKRRARHFDAATTVWYRLVERLNIAIVAGLPIATAAFFWSNRLLPTDLAGRALWEMRMFFLTWGFCVLHAFLRREWSAAWKEQLYGGGALFACLPLLNMATTQSHMLITIPNEMWRLAGIDLTSLATGLLLGWGGRHVGQIGTASQPASEPVLETQQV